MGGKFDKSVNIFPEQSKFLRVGGSGGSFVKAFLSHFSVTRAFGNGWGNMGNSLYEQSNSVSVKGNAGNRVKSLSLQFN